MFLPWISLKLWLLLVTSAMIIRNSRSTSSSPAKLKQNLCSRTCGGIEIPYPFGIGEDCSFSDGFKIECNNSNPNDTRPFKAGLEITGIDLEYSYVQVMQFISYQCYNTDGLADHNIRNIDLVKTPYLVSVNWISGSGGSNPDLDIHHLSVHRQGKIARISRILASSPMSPSRWTESSPTHQSASSQSLGTKENPEACGSSLHALSPLSPIKGRLFSPSKHPKLESFHHNKERK